VDPKALKLGVSKIKNLANEAVFVECRTEADRDVLEKELIKISTLAVGRPKKKLPTLLLKFVPIEIEDAEIKSTILQQNNLLHLSDSVLQKKSTKRSFDDARHVVIEVSPCPRRELLAIHKLKLPWSMCEVEDFITVTRCLGFGHTARFCQNQAKCSLCAGDHHRNECENKTRDKMLQLHKSKHTHTYTTIAGKQTQTTLSLVGSAPGYAGLNQ
jgi:hypothetical protein